MNDEEMPPQEEGESVPIPGASFPSLEEMARLLPQYEVISLLGAGGMGAVYLARQPALDRMVAVKITAPLYEDEADVAERFITEARAMARLVHPHIVAVFDFGQTAEGHLFIVMERVDGADLHSLIRTGALDETSVFTFMAQLCDALQFAHDHGVVHRDIKPGNVLITSERKVKIADFGLARDFTDPNAGDDGYGTPEYASPERHVAGAVVDHRADIYSLGVVLHEMVTGHTPGAGGPPLPVMYQRVVSTCMMSEPERRFRSARDVHAALFAAWQQAHPPQQQAAPRRVHAPPATRAIHYQPRRAGVPGSVWAVGCLALLAVGGWFFLQQRGDTPASAPASATTPVAAAPPDAGTVPPAGTPPAALPTTEPSRAVVHRPEVLMQSLPSFTMPDGAPGEFRKLIGPLDSVQGVVILPDQRRVVSSHGLGGMYVWDVEKGEMLARLEDSGASINALMFAPDGRKLVAGSIGGYLRLWDLTTGATTRTKTLVETVLNPTCFSPDGASVLCASSYQEKRMWKVRIDPDATPVEVTGFSLRPLSAVLMPDGSFVTTGYGSENGKVSSSETMVGSWNNESPPQLLPTPQGYYWSTAVLPGSPVVALGSNNVIFMDIQSRQPVMQPLKGHQSTVRQIRFLDGGRLVLTGGGDRTMRVWETETARELARFDSPHYVFAHVDVSRDGRWAVSGGYPVNARDNRDPEGYAIHVWRLPKFGEIGTAAGFEKLALRQLENLKEVDGELAAVKAEVEAGAAFGGEEALAGEIAALNSKYLAALRRETSRAAPADRLVMQEEAERVAAGEFIDPRIDASTVAGALRKMREIYCQQLLLLEKTHNEKRKQVHDALATRLKDVEAARQGAGDMGGVARTRALLRSCKGEVTLAGLFGAFGRRVIPLPQ